MAWICFAFGRKTRVRESTPRLEWETHHGTQGQSRTVASIPPQRSWETPNLSIAPPLGTRITSVSFSHSPTSRPSLPTPELPSQSSSIIRAATTRNPQGSGHRVRTSSSFDELTRSLPPPPRRRPSQPREKKPRPGGSVKRPPGRETPTISISTPGSRQNEPHLAQSQLSSHYQESRLDGTS